VLELKSGAGAPTEQVRPARRIRSITVVKAGVFSILRLQWQAYSVYYGCSGRRTRHITVVIADLTVGFKDPLGLLRLLRFSRIPMIIRISSACQVYLRRCAIVSFIRVGGQLYLGLSQVFLYIPSLFISPKLPNTSGQTRFHPPSSLPSSLKTLSLQTTGYCVDVVWKSTSFDRMQSALKSFAGLLWGFLCRALVL
jgi:hypothetical protein